MRVVLFIALIALGLIIGPAILIWSTNEMMEQAGLATQIDWNFWSWLAGVGFIAVVKGGSS